MYSVKLLLGMFSINGSLLLHTAVFTTYLNGNANDSDRERLGTTHAKLALTRSMAEGNPTQVLHIFEEAVQNYTEKRTVEPISPGDNKASGPVP